MHSHLKIALKLLPQLLGETLCREHQLEKQQGASLKASHIDAACNAFFLASSRTIHFRRLEIMCFALLKPADLIGEIKIFYETEKLCIYDSLPSVGKIISFE